MSVYDTIITEKIGAIGKLTFNRPKVLNAYNQTVAKEIIEGFKCLESDNNIGVIVFTGAGKAFMAGADINMLKEWIKQGEPGKIRESLENMFNPNMLEDSPKPTIAAINGLAFGMGCEIALACDYRIAGQGAKFALPEIKLGVVPGGGGTQRLPHLVGATHALEMISTGDPIDADKAYQIGLLNQVAPDDKLWESVEAFANRLLDKSATALAICKKLIYEGGELPLRQGIDYERDRFSEVLLTDDATEGTSAFLEKRNPEFNKAK